MEGRHAFKGLYRRFLLYVTHTLFPLIRQKYITKKNTTVIESKKKISELQQSWYSILQYEWPSLVGDNFWEKYHMD